jgi:hypothetical protein
LHLGINLEPGREVAIRAMIEHARLVRATYSPKFRLDSVKIRRPPPAVD